MPAKWNFHFLPCFIFLVPLKIKVKNKTQNRLIKWELKWRIIFCVWENPNFENAAFNR